MRLIIAFISLFFGVNAYGGMIDKEGMAPWEVCALCHNLDGISVMAKFPKLAGQKSEYIKKQFWDFHDERRTNDGGQMQAITTEVEPGTVDVIAEYFESLTPPEPMPVASEETENYVLGKSLFTQGREDQGRGQLPACVTCHGNAKTVAPWLYAQHSRYLKKQLEDFRDGARENDSDAVMRNIAKVLSDVDIEAITIYLESVRLR